MIRRFNKSKYGAKKVGGYDSKSEYLRSLQLKDMQAQGKIYDLKEQVPFELIPAQYETYERYGKNGKRLKDGVRLVERPVTYVADFTYYTAGDDIFVVEDVKGYKVKEYILKRKMMLYLKNIKVREVKVK